MRLLPLVAAAALGALAHASQRPAPPPARADVAASTRELHTPAPAGSLAPSLVALTDGGVLLSWLEPRGEREHALRFARRAAGSAAWSEPRTVASGERWFVNWADFPHLAALADGTLFAHWLQRPSGGSRYDYDVRLTRSHDGGRTWDAPFPPYADTTAGEHGFVALAPLDASRMGVLFLDGREAQRAGGAMTLRFAAVPKRGAPAPDARIDERVCDCCQTALARTRSGLVAAYRDRSQDELRDIAVARLERGRWSAASGPARDGWQISGCPVNGPALAASGDRVALAWFTMAGDTPRVKLAFSEDAGLSWGAPRTVDDGRPIGRVDVVLPARRDGSAVVSWVEESGAGASLRLRRVHAQGALGASISVAGTSGLRASGFPRLAEAGDGLIVAWRDVSEPGRIRSALVALP